MLPFDIELQKDFVKGNANNLPIINNTVLFRFVSVIGNCEDCDIDDLLADFIQINKSDNSFTIIAIIFNNNSECRARVCITLDEISLDITKVHCDACSELPCRHIIYFLFWLNRRNADKNLPFEFWGQIYESEWLKRSKKVLPLSAYVNVDVESNKLNKLSETEGQEFVETILLSIRAMGPQGSAFVQHFIPAEEDIEKVYIHHSMLNASENDINNSKNLIQYMRSPLVLEQFEQATKLSREMYKSKLWYEVQYMRIRCSMLYDMIQCSTELEKKKILDQLSCKNRTKRSKERIALKEQKRYIVQQTSELENKTYQPCGLMLNSDIPFLVASPDGISDDHILEIKIAKNQEEFSNYLNNGEIVAPKYMVQIQMQMFMAKQKKALYCVLGPSFITTGEIHYTWVDIDAEVVKNLLQVSKQFWEKIICPHLFSVYKAYLPLA